MLRTTLRFYGDLNDFLFGGFSGPIVQRRLSTPTSVKDLIEGCGVPHTEVDLILANDKPVDFSYLIEEDQQISVYPFFNHIDIPASERLQKPNLHQNRFLADTNLGKLARYLRMAGFDTAYIQGQSDEEIISQMLEEKRTLLSRDRKLLMHKVIEHGYLPRSDDPAEQLQEVCRRFDLFDDVDPFTRCPNCNGVLQSVSKEEVIDQLEPLTKKYFDDFSQCPDCGQIYWAGSHRQRMDERVKDLLGIGN
ncbi:Mut7-C RNAse domain-containing protein [Fodinibius sp.]|uniref:Mut7-C RNAse domain-containing protein n=1 Tax=Fodinibius sp. TaxID=1872440 RepID=UPI002ACDEE7C|nr:Mut7-C RNAse domain-containing protein [Fodinibius sp.]MDZ7658713.1 Mut7-C RNAse domain-containing protein [Fodinibius sp.]